MSIETRAGYFISEWRDKFAELIKTEMKIRAMAATDLAENFSVNGVIIEPGCDVDGTISIIKGFDEILKCYGLTRDTAAVEKSTIWQGDTEYTAYLFALPEVNGKFRYVDTECPVSAKPNIQKEKVMPYDDM